MDRQPVGYDLTASILELELLESGRGDRYFDVPDSIAEEFLAAESKEAYFNEHLRDMDAFEEEHA